MEYIYATLTLNELNQELNEENITAVLEAAGSDVIESRVKAIVAALEDVDLDELGAESGIAPAPTPDVEDEVDDASIDSDDSDERDGTPADHDGSDDVEPATDTTESSTEDVDAALDQPEAGSEAGLDAVSTAEAPGETGDETHQELRETDGGASSEESGAK